MNVITPKIEIIEQKPRLQGIYEQVERCGRVCYASEYNIKYDEEGNSTTAKSFVDRLIKSGHTSVLEHGTVYLAIPMTTYAPEAVNTYKNNPYSKVNDCHDFIFTDIYGDKVSAWCVTTNFRVLVENSCLEDLEFLCEPTEHHEKRITVRFTTDIGITREANRHRKDSMAESSTRYCNYANDRFGNELSICSNSDFSKKDIEKELKAWNYADQSSALYNMCDVIASGCNYEFKELDYWLFANLAAEWSYMNLIKLGWKPQQARRVLPLDTKSELVHTAFISDWQHFLNLRYKGTTGTPHPDFMLVSEPLYKEFVSRNYIKE